MASFLEFEGVSKSFGPLKAVQGVSLGIEKGEFYSLLGPSGCGKTTLLRMLAGFETPDAGRILLDGRDVTALPPNRRKVNTIFQSYALFPHLTVFDNVAYPLDVKRTPAADIRRAVDEVLALLELAQLAQRYPNQLSGGQQQRVALARALVTQPSLLLFDEPLSNLDARLRVHVRAEIRRLQKTLGITTVYVTHDQVEAMSMSDEIAIMRDGQIEQIGDPKTLYFRPATRYAAEFIGRANFLPGRIVAGDGQTARVAALGQEFQVESVGAVAAGDAVSIMIRPESVVLNGAGSTALRGTVRQATFAGTTVDYVVAVESVDLLVTELGSAKKRPLAEGQPVTVGLSPDTMHLISA